MKLSSILLSIASIHAQLQASSNRIVGGTEVTPKFKYPWMVALWYKSFFVCGGTLYTNNAIVTAAYCNYGDVQDWSALAHRHNKTAQDEGGLSLAIQSRVNHPRFDVKTRSFDVAVWRVDAKPSAPLLALDSGKLPEGTLLKVIGWGKLSADGPSALTLQEVQVPVASGPSCKQAYPMTDADSSFCTGFAQGGRDACFEDNGGPVFVQTGNRPTLVGVIGVRLVCGKPNSLSLYTRVASVVDFITKNV